MPLGFLLGLTRMAREAESTDFGDIVCGEIVGFTVADGSPCGDALYEAWPLGRSDEEAPDRRAWTSGTLLVGGLVVPMIEGRNLCR